MRNNYLRRARVLERDFRAMLRCFANDLPALTAARMCGVNKNTTYRLYGLLRQRVVAELKTTFASHYTQVVSLQEALQLSNIAVYNKRSTGEKFLINPNKG